jgi:hypothetical protein
MKTTKLTRHHKEFKKFGDQIEALDAFIKLTTVCLTFNNQRVEDEKDNIHSILVGLDIVFPEFFEELKTFNNFELHDKKETVHQKLKELRVGIKNAIILLKETINLEKVEPTSTDYVWWKSFLRDFSNGRA